MERKTSCIWDI